MFCRVHYNDTISMYCFIIFVLFYPILQHGHCDNSWESSFDRSVNLLKNVSNEDGTTTEIHYTTCKITTEKLSADAEAKYTRVYSGGCNTKMIEERFESLERLLNKRFNEISESIVRSKPKEKVNFSGINVEPKKADAILTGNYHLTENLIDADGNEFERGKVRGELDSLRGDEIDLYNDTVHEIEGRKVFTHYWRVSDIYEKLLQWDTGRSERSSTFYVPNAGYAMYMKFTPKYFPDGTIFVSVGITVGKNDSRLIWPFPLPVRIEILDLTTKIKDGPKDRSSRLWDPATVCSSSFWGRPRQRAMGGSSDNPECVGLSISRQFLTTPNDKRTTFISSSSPTAALAGKYLVNDSVIVKLNVYL